MSIALERGGEIKRSGFAQGIGCSPNYELPEIAGEGRRMRSPPKPEAQASTSTSSSTSSIGKNSESLGSDGEDLAGEKEVESKYKGPLSALESLEEALPVRRGISSFYNGKSKFLFYLSVYLENICLYPPTNQFDRLFKINHMICFFGRRGISSFYNGKSKSFASLSDITVSCASVKDLGKQEDAYTRKRRNLLASKNFCLKSSPGLLRSNGGGISKRSPSNGRSTLALAVAMNNSSSIQDEDHEQQHRLLPPLHPSGKNPAAGSSSVLSSSPQYSSFPLRSFSLTDLQGMSGSESSTGLKDANKRFC